MRIRETRTIRGRAARLLRLAWAVGAASAAGAAATGTATTIAAAAEAKPAAAAAGAAATGESPGETGSGPLGMDPSMSIDPSAPQVGALPGGVAPAYGRRSFSEGDWRFDFHGFITAPLNAGFNSRPMPRPGQSGTVIHTPPVVPDDLETFSHTGVVPTTYAQLNFSESNSIVSGNMSIVARQANASTSFIEPASQLGVNDLFLAVQPELSPRLRTQLLVGAFTSRYGTMGEYDEGRYGTPLIARVRGVGEEISVKLRLGKLVLMAEQGLKGQSNKASSATTPDVWNDFGNANEGATFVSHFHLGAAYAGRAMVGLHYLRAFSQDDRGAGLAPDGSMDILGADLRLLLGRFGHFYTAAAYTDARYVATVSRIIQVLNTRGGQGLIDNYLGELSSGYGTITTVGGQYDISIGKLVSYPVPFGGDGPDLFVSLFGMMAKVQSYDLRADPLTGGSRFDGVTKAKFGLEATYSLLSWLAVSSRYDQVMPNTADSRYSFAVLSPRIIFRTDWIATNQLVLQYSRWFNGAYTTVRVGDPPREDVSVVPDANMLSLSANMWW